MKLVIDIPDGWYRMIMNHHIDDARLTAGMVLHMIYDGVPFAEPKRPRWKCIMLGKKKLIRRIEQLIMEIEERYSETDGIKVGYVLQDLYKLIGEEYDEIPLKLNRK